MMQSQWSGKKVAFLGDSISDKSHVGTIKNYWQFLQEMLDIEPLVYALNGWVWKGIHTQAKKLFKEHGNNVDAIFIFMGTNDFNSSTPIGQWWDSEEVQADYGGSIHTVRKRIPNMDKSTLCGSINWGMAYLKEHFPEQQIVLMTPIHRGYAIFDEKNVQPDENHPNTSGLYVEEYIKTIREAADIWSVPIIDLFRDSGLLPVMEQYFPYFHDAETDRLHPNINGHKRLADTIMYKMLAMPSTFR